MSEFSELVRILPLDQVAEIKRILSRGDPIPLQRLASLLTMVILTVNMSKKRKSSPIKLSTFTKYRRNVAKSLYYDMSSKTVFFEYHLKNTQDLQEGLEQAIAPYNFVVKVHKKPIDWQKQLSSVHERKAGHRSILNNNVGAEISKLAETKDSTWSFIERTMDLIEARTRQPTTRVAYRFLLQLTFMNCCRANDLKNADPSTFQIIADPHLGRILRAFVPETKTSIERFIYFFPCKGRCDPLLALDSYLLWVGPVPKTQTTDEETQYDYQLLQDTLLISYDRFIAKESKENIFKIPNGPKAHLGRHLMASYLGNNSLKSEATLYGNWSVERQEGVSKMADSRYMHTVKKSPPSYLFAFLSGYYKKSNQGEYVLAETLYNPLDYDKTLPITTNEKLICRRYGKNAKVIPKDALLYLYSYVQQKRKQLADPNEQNRLFSSESPAHPFLTPQSTGSSTPLTWTAPETLSTGLMTPGEPGEE